MIWLSPNIWKEALPIYHQKNPTAVFISLSNTPYLLPASPPGEHTYWSSSHIQECFDIVWVLQLIVWIPLCCNPTSCMEILVLVSTSSGLLLPHASVCYEHTLGLLLQLEGEGGVKPKRQAQTPHLPQDEQKSSLNGLAETIWGCLETGNSRYLNLKYITRAWNVLPLRGVFCLCLWKRWSFDTSAFFPPPFSKGGGTKHKVKVCTSVLQSDLLKQRKPLKAPLGSQAAHSASGLRWLSCPGKTGSRVFDDAESNHREQMPWLSTHLAYPRSPGFLLVISSLSMENSERMKRGPLSSPLHKTEGEKKLEEQGPLLKPCVSLAFAELTAVKPAGECFSLFQEAPLLP